MEELVEDFGNGDRIGFFEEILSQIDFHSAEGDGQLIDDGLDIIQFAGRSRKDQCIGGTVNSDDHLIGFRNFSFRSVGRECGDIGH